MKRREFIKLGVGLAGLAMVPELALARTDNISEVPGKDDAGKSIAPHISIIGLGGFGVRYITGFSLKGFSELRENIQPNFIGMDTDKTSIAMAIDESDVIRPLHLPYFDYDHNGRWCGWMNVGSCNGQPALARGTAWRLNDMLFGRKNEDGYKDTKRGLLKMDQTDLAILVAGLGRGAGTGLAQTIAYQARLAGVQTVALVTLPLASEKLAVPLSRELRRLQRAADTVITIDQNVAATAMKRAAVTEHDARAWAEGQLARRLNDMVSMKYSGQGYRQG